MSQLSTLLVSELGRATLIVSVATLLATVVLRQSKLQAPRLHRAVWTLVLLSGWTFGGIRLAIPWYEASQPIDAAAAEVSPPPATTVELSTEPLAEKRIAETPTTDSASDELHQEHAALKVATTTGDVAAVPIATSTDAIAVEEHSTIAPRAPRVTPTLSLALILAVGWLAGIGAIIAIWCFGYLQFATRLSPGLAGEETWCQQWADVLQRHAQGRKIPLRVTSDIGPLLCWLPGGCELLVPEELWRSLDRAEREAILKHELAHYLRRDLFKSLLARVLALPHWFNPCAWWAVRRFDEAAEWACDQKAVEPANATTYARALLRLGEMQLGPRYGSAARTRPLASRVKRLLKLEQKDSAMKTGILLSTAMCLATLAIVRVQLVAQEPTAPPAQQPVAQPAPAPVAKPTPDAAPTPAPPGDETVEDLFKPPGDETVEDLFKAINDGVTPKLADKEPVVEERLELAPATKLAIVADKQAANAARKAVEAAEMAYKAALQSYESDNITLDELCNWSKRWLTVALQSASSARQRQLATQEHVERMKMLQERIVKLHEIGARGGTPQQVTAVNFYVAEAESQLEQLNNQAVQTRSQLPIMIEDGEKVVYEEIVERTADGKETRRVVPRRVDSKPAPATPDRSPGTAARGAGLIIAVPQPTPYKPANVASAVPAPSSRAVPDLATETVKPAGAPKAATGTLNLILPPSERDSRTRLRYDGKSFHQWKEDLISELSDTRRTEAVWAFMAFGNNGYGKEAAATIMDLMGSITSLPGGNIRRDDLIKAAQSTFQSLPREAAWPVVEEGLHSDNANKRLFAVRVLPHLQPDKAQRRALLTARLSDADPNVRAAAVDGFATMLPPIDAETVRAVKVALADVAPEVVVAGFRVIHSSNPSPGGGLAPPLDPAWSEPLVQTLGRNEDWIRKLAAERLTYIGVRALPMLDQAAAAGNSVAGDLAKRLRADADKAIATGLSNTASFNDDVDVSNWHDQIVTYYGAYAVPALEKAAAETNNPAFGRRLDELIDELKAAQAKPKKTP